MGAEPKFAPVETTTCSVSSSSADTDSKQEYDEATDHETRKAKLNAPKTIKKLENSIAKWEEKLAELDNEMLQNGKDVGKLTDLQKEKDKINEKVDKLYAEMEIQLELL